MDYFSIYSRLTTDQLYDKLSEVSKQYTFYSIMGNYAAMDTLANINETIQGIIDDRLDEDLFNKYHKPGTAIDTSAEPKKDDSTNKPKPKRRRFLFDGDGIN